MEYHLTSMQEMKFNMNEIKNELMLYAEMEARRCRVNLLKKDRAQHHHLLVLIIKIIKTTTTPALYIIQFVPRQIPKTQRNMYVYCVL